MADAKSKVKGAAFVSAVVKDPEEPPGVVLLSGFLGPSSEEGHTRLYFDPQLRSYVDIPDDAIRHTQDLSKDASPLGGSYVWIDESTQFATPPGGEPTQQNEGDKTMSYTIPPYCPPQGSGYSAQGPAFPTVPASQCLSIPIVCCPLTGAHGAGQGAAQAATFPTLPPQCGLPQTLPPQCGLPTVQPPTCLPPVCGQAAGAQQANFPTIPASQCLTVPLVCCPVTGTQGAAHLGAGGQAATFPPLCFPTVFPPTCLPPMCGQGAVAQQANFPTIPASQCASVPIVCC